MFFKNKKVGCDIHENMTLTPMPPVKLLKKASSDCDACIHRKCCKYKRKFMEQRSMMYPQVCNCELYEVRFDGLKMIPIR